MLPEQQQRILGYFIEEAKDHLNTIEQGLLNLQNTLADPEMVNEIFRAAHSIKGGAAMLGLNSIQRTSHLLEDSFKIFQECPTLQVDQKLESLFLRVFDTLQELVEELETSLCLTEDVENKVMAEVGPVFETLNQYLELLVSKSGGSVPLEVVTPRYETEHSAAPVQKIASLSGFKGKVLQHLRQMLEIFKQSETPESREQLQEYTLQLLQLGQEFKLPGWCTLCETVSGAIADVNNAYRTLAPIVIKEFKQSQELVTAGREAQITVSEKLQALSVTTFSLDWEDIPASELSDTEQDSAVGFLDSDDPQISSIGDTEVSSAQDFFNEALVLNSLFNDSDTPALLTTREPDFVDLFDSEAESEQIEVSKSTQETVDDGLISWWEEEPASPQTSLAYLRENASEFSLLEDAGDDLFEELAGADPTISAEKQTTAANNLELQISDSLSEFFGEFDDIWGDTENTSAATNVPVDMSSADLTTEADLRRGSQNTDLSFIYNLEETETDSEDLFDVDTAPDHELASPVISLDDFSEWDELLGEALFEPIPATATAPNDAISSDLLELFTPTLEPILGSAATTPNASVITEEFGDLEDLLQEAKTEAAPAKVTPPTVQQPNSRLAADSARAIGSLEQMMRVPVKQLDNVSNLVGELVVYRNTLEQDQERLRQFLDNLLHQVQQLGNVSSRMQEMYEQSLLEASLLNSRQGSRFVSLDAPSDSAHATGMNFDALEMDRFTGFHPLAQEIIELIVRVRESASDIEFITEETEQVARQFRQVTGQLQEGLTRSRMVPFTQIAERLPRAVRDISLKYGKQAELHIEGRDTLIDKVILEQLYDPMTHLVNNAITHGIETPQERAHKSPVGQITIRAFLQGNQTIISISDDGAGIDTERVKAKAFQKGLITREVAKTMSRLDVYNLLFHPGLSTKDQVDDFAGRGVGMDVVKTSLNKIKGVITIDSTLGKGTTFTIRLPLTLSISKALCCVSDKARIAFPMDGVEQMIDISVKNVIVSPEGQSCISWRDSLLPFRPLKELLPYNRQLTRGNVYGGNREDDMTSIVVLRSAGIFIGVQVDQVLGEQEVVIKQFEGPAPKPLGVAGATILGDGRIMPIADVLELIELSTGRLQKGSGWNQNSTPVRPEKATIIKTEPTVLIVDDSITVRELLSMTFNNAGYRVEQARDGQEAWAKLCDGLPCDIVFCDIEMPRMDGLELLSRMQKDPKLSHLPIAMLTSRGADRHRQMALQLGASGYITKPYLEEALLDAAARMIKGEVLLSANTL